MPLLNLLNKLLVSVSSVVGKFGAFTWLILVVGFAIFAIFRYIFKRFKQRKLDRLTRYQRSQIDEQSQPRNFLSYYSNFLLTPPVNYTSNIPVSDTRLYRSEFEDQEEDNEVVLDRLFVSFRGRTNSDPPTYINPPDYNSLSVKKVPSQYLGPPPKYSSACKIQDACSNSEIKGVETTLTTVTTIPQVPNIQTINVDVHVSARGDGTVATAPSIESFKQDSAHAPTISNSCAKDTDQTSNL